MADFNDLLSQAAGTPSTQPSMSLLDEKKAAVSLAADEKKASMGGTGLSDYDMATGRMYGQVPQNVSEVERDLMTMDASNLYGKYGNAASSLLAQRNAANRQVTQDATSDWNGTLSQVGTDVNDLVTGLGQSLGSWASLGVNLVNKDAGVAMATGVADAAEWANSLQSDERQGRRNVAESLNRLDDQDILAQMEKDIETDGELIAKLNVIGRQSYAAVANATEDSTNVIGGSINALGSLLAAGPVSKLIGGVGKLAVANNTGRATVLAAEMGNPAARAAVAVGANAPILTAIGSLEAGGAYQQITADVMGRDFDTLYAESPQFRELVDGGMEPADAQIQVASDAGKMAAAITAPLAAATGILVRGFEGNPFARTSATQMLSNLFREPTEEAIQGGTSQLAQNYAESKTANENQDLVENVGRQIGEGALYSVGSTAVTQLPNAAAQVASTASKTAMNALRASAAARTKANEATSPVSDEAVAAAVAEATANAAQDEQAMHQAVASMEGTDEQKDRASTYVNTVMDAIKFSEEDLLAASPNRLIRSVLNGSQNRLEAVQRLSDMVANTEPDSPEHLRAGFALYEMLGPLQNALETNAEQADAVLPDSPVGKALAGYEAVLSGIQNSPKVIKALQQMQAAVERRAAQPTAEINDATVETTVGQQAAQDTIAIAQVAPDKANLRATEQVLFQVSQGKLQVTPQQKAALDSTVALLRAAQAADVEAVQLGLSDKTSKVTRNIQSEDGEKGKSALQHSQDIMSAWKAGNLDLARDRLVHLGELVQHMQNKVSALNAHVAAGNPNADGLRYQALTSDRKWVSSNLKMFVNFGSKKSIQQAQQIGSDATFLANVFNGLATAFPNLGVPHINATPLDSSLNAPADEVMSAYKASRANAPAVDATTTVPAETLTQTGYESLSDEDLNSQLNAAHDALIANPRDRQLREIFDALDEEMLRREEAAAAKIQQEELEEEQAERERQARRNQEVRESSAETAVVPSEQGTPSSRTESGPNVVPSTDEQTKILLQEAHIAFTEGEGEAAKNAARAAFPEGLTVQDNGRFGFFYFKTPNGNDLAGSFALANDGSVIRNFDVRSSTNTSGTSEVRVLRTLAKNLQLAYPNLNELVAQRVTGVRSGNAEFLRFSVKNGKLTVVDRAPARYEDGDPRAPEAWNTPLGKSAPQSAPADTSVPAQVVEPAPVETAEPAEEQINSEPAVEDATRRAGTIMENIHDRAPRDSELVWAQDGVPPVANDRFTPNAAQQAVIDETHSFIEMVFDADLPKTPVMLAAFNSPDDKLQAYFDEADGVVVLPPKLFLALHNGENDPYYDQALHVYAHEVLHAVESSKFTAVLAKFNQEYAAASPAGKAIFDAYAMTFPAGKERDSEIVSELAGAFFTQSAALRKNFPVTSNLFLSALSGETVAEPVEVTATTSSGTGLSVLYPDLMGEDNNFIKAFDLPKEQLTRTIGTEEPLSFIQDALQNSLTLGNLLGHVPKKDFNKDVAAAYQSYLKLGDGILEKLNENLQAFLDGEYAGTTRRDLLINNKAFTTGRGTDLLGEDIAKFSSAKTLNLTEVTGGTLAYNNELVQMAVLASLQWLLTAEQRETQLDAEDIADFLKIDAEEVLPSWVELYNTGLDQTEAKRALAAKIKQYWGVVDKKTGRKGYTEGIPESMAAEIIRVLVDNGGLGYTREIIVLPPSEESDKPRKRTVARLIPPALEKPSKDSLGSPLLAYSTAIEDAVMVTPVERTYIGEDQIPSVAQKQLRNPDVDNTPQQKQVIENEQKTPYFVNTKMVSLYMALGRDNLIDLFGSPERGRVFNVNHAKTVEGRNRNIIAAFDQLMGTVSEVQGVARVAGQSIESVPIRFEFNMTRVARAQMLGRYSPQASKLVREAILPTRATLNMENLDHRNGFMLGVAQAIGLSVHKMLPKDAIAKAAALVTGDGALVEVRTLLGDFLAGYSTPTTADIAEIELNPELTQKIKAAFAKAKKPVTELALHALMELAWLDKQDARGRSQFQTSLYLEADGITNGPVNAMVLLAKGAFSTEELRNFAKGGLFFGRGQMSFNEHFVHTDDKDLYQTSTDKLKEFMADLNKELATNKKGQEQMKNLLALMDLFIPDLEYKDGVLTLERGIAKNPLTITIYGSSQRGIANKLTGILTDAIYERMSLLAEARAVNPQASIADAMFDGDTAKAAVFTSSLANLITNEITRTKKNGLVVKLNRSDRDDAPINPQTFTFNAVELKNLRSNMRHLLVAPMDKAISQTVGETTLVSATLIRQATQAQSIILESVFKKEIAAETERLKKTDKWRTTDSLTQAELNRIKKNMAHLSPFVKTPTQTFYIAGKQSVDLDDLRYGEALDGSYESPAAISGPRNAGVAGIPFMVIGTGDAQMMQNISVDPNAPTGTLKIFDGMNMPLDQIQEGSRVANKAVWDSWMGNTLKAVHDSFANFMKDAPLGNYDADTRKALTRALFPPEFRDVVVSDKDILAKLEHVLHMLNWSQKSVEARHRAMARAGAAIDQMASAGAPYFHKGNDADAIPAGYNDEQIVTHLNLLYAEELAKLNAEPEVTSRLTKEVMALGTKREGVYEFNSEDIRNISKAIKLPEGQDGVLRDVVSSLATKGYTMVVGPAANIRKYIKDTGSVGTGDRQVDGEIKGFTNIAEKKIYSLNPSTETMVHELVHAATFETILAFFNGDALHPQTKAAVKRIGVLMDQFLSMEGELVQPNAALQQSYADAVAAIRSWQNDRGLPAAERNAGALNEFMAWNLSNQELIRLGQRTQASKLARIVHSVLKAVRSLFWGKHRVPTPAKDMFTNLRFNSAIIMRSNPTTAQRFVSGVTFQNSQYGNNDRLSEINKAFNTSVARYLGTTVQPGEVAPSDAVDTGIVNALRVSDSFQANGFVMSQQEATTFRNIVTALSTEAALDSNALTLAQKLYAHVTKQLTVEHFMKDAESTNPADRYYAQRKFDSIMGTNLVELDLKGRSTLMPAFLALATVNDEFRAVLAQIDMPASLKLEERSLDAALTNTGRSMMDSLGNRMAGISSADKSVKQAVDALQQHIAEQVQNREMFIDQLASKAGRGIDRANEIIVEKATLLADTIGAKGDALNQEGRNAVTRAIGASAQALSILTSNERGEFAAQGITAAMNQVKGFAPIRALLNDFVGRTISNAGVYDLIKGVRSMVQQARQQFREDLPQTIASKFSRELTKQEWASLFRSIGKTDLAVLRAFFSKADIRNMLTSASDLQKRVSTLETYIQNADPTHYALYQEKMTQLATYMNTGVQGRSLLRNAEAISRLLNENTQENFFRKDKDFVAAVDQLVTLYALQDLSQEDKDVLAAMSRDEATGLDFVIDYLVGQRAEEQAKMSPAALLNHYKGYIPQENLQGVSMVIGSSRDHAKLLSRSYVRVGSYRGGAAERLRNQDVHYYFAPVAARAAFEQGIMQNVRQSVSGVDANTGYSLSPTAGRVTEPTKVKILARSMRTDRTQTEALMPIFDENDNVVAVERSLDPVVMERVAGEQHLANAIGVWRGRQHEEATAGEYNRTLVDRLKEMLDADMAKSASNINQYVDLFGPIEDPVIADAVKLMSPETRAYAQKVFGPEFMVRKDMLLDVLGERNASIGDAWTGITRWSPETQEAVRELAQSVFGNKAYQKLVNSERAVQGVVSDIRTLIVVKSVVIPMANLMSNVYQLISRGVPLKSILRGMPRKVAEVDSYIRTRRRQIEVEAELRAAVGNVVAERRLKAEWQSIQDGHKRLSIWPLIQAGEFSSISDAQVSREDLNLTQGRLAEFIEGAVNKLPAPIATMGRYGLITKDTALFKALQKSVEYGDFLAKAVLFDDLTKRKQMSKKEALGRITEEYVNYDRLSGRFRGTLEKLGVIWFYNFKLRTSKVALSTIRNNPLHALLAMAAPAPEMFGSVGLPILDNVFTKAADGSLVFSIGPGQGFSALGLNPWVNLTQ